MVHLGADPNNSLPKVVSTAQQEQADAAVRKFSGEPQVKVYFGRGLVTGRVTGVDPKTGNVSVRIARSRYARSYAPGAVTLIEKPKESSGA